MENEMSWFTTYRTKMKAVRMVAVCAALLAGLTIGSRAEAQTHAHAAAVHAAGMQAGPQKGQHTYATAQGAVQALVAALEKNDSHALIAVLGPDAETIVNSGDAVEDQQDHEQFLAKYKQMHRLVTELDGLTTLYVGAENWPMPIPLTHEGNAWYFDTVTAKSEILYRRIGRNELAVIQVCGELAAAEKEYHAVAHDGSTQKEYAQKIMSSPGKHDGLYWQATAGAAQSPLGPLVASAEQEGYAEGSSPRKTPFYGYYFRILKAQGANAPGGAESYLVDGKMTRGFAFLAYPAEYRSSGVMTFLVGQDGVVYQKDLGKRTAEIAKSIKAYDPDPSWQEADQ
jgi:hypothetical protein